MFLFSEKKKNAMIYIFRIPTIIVLRYYTACANCYHTSRYSSLVGLLFCGRVAIPQREKKKNTKMLPLRTGLCVACRARREPLGPTGPAGHNTDSSRGRQSGGMRRERSSLGGESDERQTPGIRKSTGSPRGPGGPGHWGGRSPLRPRGLSAKNKKGGRCGWAPGHARPRPPHCYHAGQSSATRFANTGLP